jgi:hypothetical protein
VYLFDSLGALAHVSKDRSYDSSYPGANPGANPTRLTLYLHVYLFSRAHHLVVLYLSRPSDLLFPFPVQSLDIISLRLKVSLRYQRFVFSGI